MLGAADHVHRGHDPLPQPPAQCRHPVRGGSGGGRDPQRSQETLQLARPVCLAGAGQQQVHTRLDRSDGSARHV